MSHAYPLATALDDALKPEAPAARTRADAEALAGDMKVEALVTDWLTVSAEEAARLLSQKTEDGAHGHLQRYEDDKGAPVIAVTWWKLLSAKAAKGKGAKAKPKPAENPPAPEAPADHTDDLYFRAGRTKPRRSKKTVDPNQMDLFGEKKAE